MTKSGFVNLEATLESGQLFSHQKLANGCYEVPIEGCLVQISELRGKLDWHLNGSTQQAIHHFFDLDYDLNPIHESLRDNKQTEKVVDAFPGLRLLHQSTWEAFVCFILSANNNILRIKKMRHQLVQYFIPHSRALFPPVEMIAKSNEVILRKLGLGYRAPYLLKTCQMILENKKSFFELSNMSTEEAVQHLIQYPGIGPKVADCVLLYGFHRLDVFPMDVWMIKVMKALYFKRRNINEKKMRAWAMKKWGSHAGYVQQYLFHGARTGLIEV